MPGASPQYENEMGTESTPAPTVVATRFMLAATDRERRLRELEAGLQQAALRAKMARLLRSPEVRTPLARIEQQISEGLIGVRPTLNLTADVGLRNQLLQLLDCYNPIWLRLGLEALMGEAAPGGPAGGTSRCL